PASPGRPGEFRPVPAAAARCRPERRNRAGPRNQEERLRSAGQSPRPPSQTRPPGPPGQPGPATTSSAAAAAHGAPRQQPPRQPPRSGPLSAVCRTGPDRQGGQPPALRRANTPAVIKIHRLRPASVIDEINVVTLTTRPRIAK